MEKIIRKRSLEESSIKDDLAYWLSRPPEERVEAVEILRDNIMENYPECRELLGLFNERKGSHLQGVLARRKPMKLRRYVGSSKPRLADRQYPAL